MIGWILSLAGLGGIGAAIAFIPGALPIVTGLATSAIEIAKKLPAWIWPMAALVALCGVQTWRVGHKASQLENVQAALKTAKQGIENMRVASLQALKAAKENKVRVETQYVKVKDNAQIAIADRLRSELDRVRSAAANQGGTGATGVPGPAATAVDPFGRDRAAIVHDAEVCTANTVKAEGWQDWYKAASAIDRGTK